MTNHFFRFAAITALLLTAEMVGRGQGALRPGPSLSGQSPSGFAAPQAPYPAQPGGGYGERMAMVDPDKKLSAGDQVTVEIVEDKEGGLPRVVTATGDLDVFPIGRVHVAGKTTMEACQDIKRKLEADYYYHATVNLSIDAVSRFQVNAGLVFLSGEIRQLGPQEMVAGQPLTLSNVILKAGGATQWGDLTSVRVTRKAGAKTDTLKYNVKKIIETGDITNDPVLQDGDRIYVPKRFIVY